MSPPVSSNALAIPVRAARRPPAARRRAPLPAVDERLVMPETRYEVIDGKVEYVPPSDEPHGSRHSKVSTLLEIHAAKDYDVASDMLTRTSAKGDMAPDASVFPVARDRQTGGRQLEELAFEVLGTERLGHAAAKARALAARGVRRVFAIDVERRRALEWSAQTNGWEILPADGAIEDRALVKPLPLRALVEAAKADDAVAEALIAKKNAVIEAAIQKATRKAERKGKQLGKREGKIAALLSILEARGLRISKKAAKRIQTEDDEAVVDAWIRRAVECASVEALIGKG